MNHSPFLSSYKFQSKPSEFALVVRERVRSYFAKNNIKKQGGLKHISKALFMIAIYLVAYLLIIFEVGTQGVLFWVWELLLALGFIGVGMVITHDASHYAVSSKRTVNVVLRHFFDLVGPSSAIWQIQHVILHHQFTNIAGIDEDINPSEMVRFSPEVPWRSWHKYQHYFVWLVYCLNTLYWLTLKDVECFFRYYKRGYFKAAQMNVALEALKFLIFKSFYFSYMILVPIYFTEIGAAKVIMGWLFMQIVGGLFLALIIQPGHVLSTLSYSKASPELKQQDKLVDRMDYQTTTTANFGNNSRLLTWFTGGLNYQIEHHLFPDVSHIHYKRISPIVRETISEFGLPYNHNKSWWSGIKEHYKMMKALSKENISELN